MSIIDSYHEFSEPLIKIKDTYPKSDIAFQAFIVTFSRRIIEALLEEKLIEVVSLDLIKCVSCDFPVYRFIGTNIGIVKTTVGAPITTAIIEEVSYIYSCNKVVLFGNCGSLDKSIPINKLMVISDAYRDEGVSYHYMKPSDYIKIKNFEKVCQIFDEHKIEYVTGKTWTTDAFYRETKEEILLRKSDGCIAVEMELSACQAVCNYCNIELYNFLYRADNLDSKEWERGQHDSLLSKNKRLEILKVAYLLATNI